MESGCARPDCTIAETGRCLLNHEPASCPDRVTATEPETEPATAALLPKKVAFPGSQAYTLTEARGLMEERYVHLIGILGEPDAGKTGCLVSLYLSVGRRLLEGFRFTDSRTLMGFEEVSRGARRWNRGRIPEQFTDHTERPDGRTAGFLHIQLAREQHGNSVDLLCSDLPGEWTTELIEKNRVDRLEFLRHADAIWLVVDGTELAAAEKRQPCVQKTKLVIERLSNFLGGGRRLLLVVTHADQELPDEGVVRDICAEGTKRGFDTRPVSVASFSGDGRVAAGTGISTLIELTTAIDRKVTVVWEPDGIASFQLPEIGLVRRGQDEG